MAPPANAYKNDYFMQHPNVEDFSSMEGHRPHLPSQPNINQHQQPNIFDDGQRKSKMYSTATPINHARGFGANSKISNNQATIEYASNAYDSASSHFNKTNAAATPTPDGTLT